MNDWIKCSERLPTKSGSYWCAYEATELSNKCTSFDYFDSLNQQWVDLSFRGPRLIPTWWCELPEAPND